MWNGPPGSDAPTLPEHLLSPQPAPVPPPRATPPVRPPRGRGAVAGLARKLAQVVGLAADLVVAVLLLRLALLFLGANPSAAFAQLIYGLSAPLVTPFQGLFPGVVIARGAVDVAAIVAIVVYLLAARLLQAAVRLLA